MNANETLGLSAEQIAEMDRRRAAAEEAAAAVDPDVELLEPDEVSNPDEPGTDLVVVNELTGEVLDLKAAGTTELAVALDKFDELVSQARAAFRDAVAGELIARMDKRNKRTATLAAEGRPTVALETNKPTETDYLIDVLRDGLEALVAENKLEREVLEECIKTPPPTTPEPKVYKREVEKLLGSDDPAVVAAVVRARKVRNTNRTIKVKVRYHDEEAGANE